MRDYSIKTIDSSKWKFVSNNPIFDSLWTKISILEFPFKVQNLIGDYSIYSIRDALWRDLGPAYVLRCLFFTDFAF